MSTIYLKFTDQAAAVAAMQAAGYELSEYQDMCSGNGWGPLFSTPDTEGYFANIYDCNTIHESIEQYIVPAPLTPYNMRAGDNIQTINLTVYVSDVIRDQARAMVVQLAGPTHSNMWSTPVERDGQQWWVNSGPVRMELVALLQNAELLSEAFGMTIEQAEFLLSQCVLEF